MREATPVTLALVCLLAAGPTLAAQSLKERARLPGDAQLVQCLAFSPDGRTLATGRRGFEPKTYRNWGVVQLWDVAAGKERFSFTGHTAGIDAVAFSPDGTTLATAASDAVLLWEAATGKPRLTLRGHPFHALCLAFSPDGKALGTAGDREVRLWETATGRELVSFKRLVRGHALAFSPDLRTLAASNFQDVDLWDVAAGKERRVLADHRGAAVGVAFSADGKTLAVACIRRLDDRGYAGEVKIWDALTGRERSTLKGHVNCTRALALSPDGRTVALAGSRELGGEEELKLLDAASGRELTVVPFRDKRSVGRLAFSPDGRLLAAVTGTAVRLWDVVPPADQAPASAPRGP
jgi:WD40 repeat protein